MATSEDGPPGHEEPIDLFGQDDQEVPHAPAPAADDESFVTFGYGGISQMVQLLPTQAISTAQIVQLFGLNTDQLMLTQDGAGPRIRIFPVNGSFPSLRAGRSYFVDVHSVVPSGHQTFSSATGSPRPAPGFLPIAQMRPQASIPTPSISPTQGSLKITVTLGEWAGRGSRIETRHRELTLKLTETTANVAYIAQAVRTHFQDETLELFSGNKSIIEDSDGSRGLEAWKSRTTPRTRYWACPPPPSKKRSLGGTSNQGETSDSERASNEVVTQASLAKALKTAFEKLENLPSTSSAPAPPTTGPPPFSCALCYGPVLPNIKICKECGQIVCGACIDGMAGRANNEGSVFKCPFCREDFARFMPVRGLE